MFSSSLFFEEGDFESEGEFVRMVGLIMFEKLDMFVPSRFMFENRLLELERRLVRLMPFSAFVVKGKL